MMSLELYLSFVLASAVLVVIPGPAVTVIVSNATSHGTNAGLKTILGNSAAMAFLLLGLLIGLTPVMELMAEWFDWFRLAGAVYLIWLGYSRFRAAGKHMSGKQQTGGKNNFVLQGILVALSNPKALLFFGVFLPQFIDPAGDVSSQLALLAATFLVIATLLDSGYAVLAGRAKSWITGAGSRRIDQTSGLVLMGGGVWLALARR